MRSSKYLARPFREMEHAGTPSIRCLVSLSKLEVDRRARYAHITEKGQQIMQTGKVKWFNAVKGFGFITQDDGGDVYLHRSALPEGVREVTEGQCLEFGVAAAPRGPEALQVRVVGESPSASEPRRAAEDLHGLIGDMVDMLESKVQPHLRQGYYPDRSTARIVAEIIRAVARDLTNVSSASTT